MSVRSQHNVKAEKIIRRVLLEKKPEWILAFNWAQCSALTCDFWNFYQYGIKVELFRFLNGLMEVRKLLVCFRSFAFRWRCAGCMLWSMHQLYFAKPGLFFSPLILHRCSLRAISSSGDIQLIRNPAP